MNETERKVKSVLKNEYDRVFKCSKSGIDPSWYAMDRKMMRIRFSKECNYNEVKTLQHFLRTGVPDFVAFNHSYDSVDDYKNKSELGNITDYIFVEVKKRGDGIRSSQLKWLNDFPELDTEVWVVDNEEKVISNKLNWNGLTAKFLADEWLELLKFDPGDPVEINVKDSDTLEVTQKG